MKAVAVKPRVHVARRTTIQSPQARQTPRGRTRQGQARHPLGQRSEGIISRCIKDLSDMGVHDIERFLGIPLAPKPKIPNRFEVALYHRRSDEARNWDLWLSRRSSRNGG